MSSRDTRASRDLSHLSVEQLLAPSRGRGRGSRSPSPLALPGAKFFTPAFAHQQEEEPEDSFADAEEVGTMPFNDHIPPDATPEEIRRIADQARQENEILRRNQDRITAALEAASQAASSATAALQALALNIPQTTHPAANSKRKRPELPALDKTNIHIWIQRVESAYAREDVTDPKQKFAFLESIIGVNLGPTINNFMFGEATVENWTAFLEHLKDIYGPTKETRCSIYLDGIKRNGLRPSDHLALIQDRVKDVTLDDLQKQLILRELPTDVKKLVQNKVERLDAKATAMLADAHFAKDGQPLNANTSVSSISSQPVPEIYSHSSGQLTTDMPSNNAYSLPEEADVNAIQGRSRAPQRNYNKPSNRAPQRSNNFNNYDNRGGSAKQNRYTPAFGSGTSQSRNRTSSRPNTTPGQTNGHSAPTTPSSEERQYSNCKLHAADPNSQLCNGPLCPLHARATLCYSRRCDTHGQGGNGRGGRR